MGEDNQPDGVTLTAAIMASSAKKEKMLSFSTILDTQ